MLGKYTYLNKFIYILRLWLTIKDFLRRSVLHTGTLNFLLLRSCLWCSALGGSRPASLWLMSREEVFLFPNPRYSEELNLRMNVIFIFSIWASLSLYKHNSWELPIKLHNSLLLVHKLWVNQFIWHFYCLVLKFEMIGLECCCWAWLTNWCT